MSKTLPEYVVVEGPIGVGKTTLAKRLAQTLNSDLLLELASDNPFLPKFYEDRTGTALPTQLHFLFQRVKQVEALKQSDLFRPARVTDFLMQKDRLFAQATLNEQELDLYFQVYNRLTLEAPVPDLVIYLQAPVESLLKRIYERGISYEKNIDEAYLKMIADAYVEFFYHYNDSPLLIVNTEDFDLTDKSRDYEVLLNYIQDLTPGRHYFNPKGL